jgi:hypothetical protein
MAESAKTLSWLGHDSQNPKGTSGIFAGNESWKAGRQA